MPTPTTSSKEPSLVDLLRELRDETSELIREEVALAKTEVVEGAKSAGRNIGLLVVGALIGFVAVIMLLMGVAKLVALMFAALDLSPALSEFLGYAIVAIVVGGAAAAVVSKALAALQGNPLKPKKTIETLKEDKQWIQEKLT